MSDHIHTIDDLQKRTGLSINYLKRVSADLAEALLEAEYRVNGNNNEALYNTNGLLTFDQVKQLRESGLNRPQVVKKIAKQLQSRDEPSRETSPSSAHNDGETGILEAQRFAIEAVKGAYEGQISALQDQITQLKQTQTLLTDGRSIEELRDERERRHGNLKRRGELLEELQALDGKWFKGKKRRRIMSGLQNLQL